MHLTILENIFYVMSLIVLLIIYNGFGLWNKYPAKFFIVQKSVISLVAHIQLLLDILEHVEYKCEIKSWKVSKTYVSHWGEKYLIKRAKQYLKKMDNSDHFHVSSFGREFWSLDINRDTAGSMVALFISTISWWTQHHDTTN